MKRRFMTGGLIALLVIPAAQALADNSNQDGVTVGIMGAYAPRYSGADKQHWVILPLIQARDGAFFVDTEKGLGYDLQADNGFYFEHVLGYSFGRADKNSKWRDGSDKLQGMGNINGALNTQFAFGWQITDWFIPEIRATLPLTDSQGVEYQTSLTLIPWQDNTDTLAIQSAALFGDARNLNTWYGVNSKQSRDSGYRGYNTGSGFYGMQSSLSWQHQFNQHWGGTLGAEYTWLMDKVADSPLVSSRNNVTGFADIAWTF